MTIEKVTCPILNGTTTTGINSNTTTTVTKCNQIFVQFSNQTEQPLAIMCHRYVDSKCNYRDEDCIYSKWRPFNIK